MLMKKLISIFVLVVAFTFTIAAQDSNTSVNTTNSTEKVVKCSEAEKAQCQKDAEKVGAKCETTNVNTEKSCGKAGKCSKGGSCCQKDGKGSSCSKDGKEGKGGSCCQKGGSASNGGSCCKKGGTAENIEKKSEEKK